MAWESVGGRHGVMARTVRNRWASSRRQKRETGPPNGHGLDSDRACQVGWDV